MKVIVLFPKVRLLVYPQLLDYDAHGSVQISQNSGHARRVIAAGLAAGVGLAARRNMR